MLDAMLRADGLTSVAAGNVGLPLCEVVMNPEPYDVVAVELSSHQLYWSDSLSPHSAAVLNVAPDHISWHGRLCVVHRGQGQDLPPHPAVGRLQRRGPGDSHDGRGGRGRRGLPGHRLHHGNPRDGHGGGGRRRDRRPRVHRGTRAQRRRARAGVRRPDRRAAHGRERPGRGHPRPILRGRRVVGATGAAVVHPRPAPDRGGGRRRRGPVRRRLEGDQPAGGARLTLARTTPSSGSPVVWPRARRSTRWCSRQPAGCAQPCCSAPIAT